MIGKLMKWAVTGGIALLLVACGGSSGGGGGTTTTTQAPKSNISAITVNDASKAPIAGASVKLSSVVAAKAGIAKLSPRAVANTNSKVDLGTFTTGSDGKIQLPSGLAPGTYTLDVTIDGVPATVTFTVGANNSIAEVKILTPLSKNSSSWKNLKDTAVIASVSGAVFDASGTPIKGATVSLSGGTATNGAVATAVTDADGHYDLLINVAISKQSALLDSTLTVSATGYEDHTMTGYQVMNGNSTTGVNFVLSAAAAAASDALWEETFETATAGDWIVGPDAGAQVKWQKRTAGVSITNQAYTNELVQLAPDDTSNGAIPDPAGGSYAFWYGDGAAGNFLGTSTSSNGSFDGGYGQSANSGTLTSPTIDLSGVPTSQPVSLTFKTWWEIESVNPNSSGFDWMTVSVSTDNGSTWTDVARLNPLADPQDSIDRSALPYSNTGYNTAPAWAQQEAIPLEGVQGKSIKLRFSFDTRDEMFNGFRGWMIDDLQILPKEGTFPTLDSSTGGYQEAAYLYVSYDPTTYEPVVSPQPYDASYNEVPLSAGQSKDFAATVSYTNPNGNGTTLQFVFKDMYDTELGQPFGAATSGLSTTSSETSADVAGTATVPANESYVSLWALMLDASGNLVTETYVTSYSVQ